MLRVKKWCGFNISILNQKDFKNYIQTSNLAQVEKQGEL